MTRKKSIKDNFNKLLSSGKFKELKSLVQKKLQTKSSENKTATSTKISLPKLGRSHALRQKIPALGNIINKLPALNAQQVKQVKRKLKSFLRKINPETIKDFPSYFFSQDAKPHIHRTFLVLVFIVTGWHVGRLTAFLLTPTEIGSRAHIVEYQDEGFKRSDFATIKTAQLLQTKQADQEQLEKQKREQRQRQKDEGPTLADNQCLRGEQKSTLPIKLINTVVLQDKVKSIASVQVRNDQKKVRIGDKIDGIARIDQISRLKMIVRNLKNGTCETIDNEDHQPQTKLSIMDPQKAKALDKKLKPQGIESDGTNFTISKKLINEKLEDMGSLLTQAKGTPVRNPDGSLSFIISDVQAGSVFSYLGVEDGDVITHINGEKIQDLNEVMGLFGRIKALDNLQITVDRDGSASQLDYQFK